MSSVDVIVVDMVILDESPVLAETATEEMRPSNGGLGRNKACFIRIKLRTEEVAVTRAEHVLKGLEEKEFQAWMGVEG
jgi:hypothetical protein